MDDAMVDRVLVRELGRVGGVGAALVARLLPRSVGTAELGLALPPAEAEGLVRRVLAAAGVPVELDPAEEGAVACAVVGTGYGRLNPAVVAVRVLAAAGGGASVTVRGVAKEGLVRQRGGEQAAAEVAALLRRAAGSIT